MNLKFLRNQHLEVIFISEASSSLKMLQLLILSPVALLLKSAHLSLAHVPKAADPSYIVQASHGTTAVGYRVRLL